MKDNQKFKCSAAPNNVISLMKSLSLKFVLSTIKTTTASLTSNSQHTQIYGTLSYQQTLSLKKYNLFAILYNAIGQSLSTVRTGKPLAIIDERLRSLQQIRGACQVNLFHQKFQITLWISICITFCSLLWQPVDLLACDINILFHSLSCFKGLLTTNIFWFDTVAIKVKSL